MSGGNDGKEVKTGFDKITDGYKINTTGGYRYYIEDKTANASVSYTSADTSIVQLGSMGADRRVEIVPKGPGYVNITGKVKGQNISRIIRLSVIEPYIAVSDSVLKAAVSNKSVLTSGGKVMSGNEIRINVTNTALKIPEVYETPTIQIKERTGKDAGDRYMSEYRQEGIQQCGKCSEGGISH